jgi:hypothetical protein
MNKLSASYEEGLLEDLKNPAEAAECTQCNLLYVIQPQNSA